MSPGTRARVVALAGIALIGAAAVVLMLFRTRSGEDAEPASDGATSSAVPSSSASPPNTPRRTAAPSATAATTATTAATPATSTPTGAAATPTASATPTRTGTPTRTPSPTLTATPAAGALRKGSRAVVSGLGGDVLLVRAGAGQTFPVIGRLAEGTAVTLVSDRRADAAGAFLWWQAELPDGSLGWIAEGPADGSAAWLKPAG